MADEIKETMSKTIKIVAISSIVIFVALATVAGVGAMYDTRIIPSLKIGNVNLGGKTEDQVRTELQTMAKHLAETGVMIEYDRGQGQETLQIPVEKVFNVEVAVAEILNFGKQGNILVRGGHVLTSFVGQAKMDLPGIVFNPEQADELIKSNVVQFEKPAKNADFKISSVTPFSFTVSTSSPGVVFDYTNVGEKIISAWKDLSVPQIKLVSIIDQPKISEADLVKYLNEQGSGTALVYNSPVILTHYDTHTKRPYQWSISKQQLADWSEIKRNESGVYLAINTESVSQFVSSTIKKVVDKPAADASFQLNAAGTKAVKFVGGRPGVTVDLPATEKGIEEVFASRSAGKAVTSTPVVVVTVQPTIKTEDTNNLGIKEILGYGWSTFSGSPRNRILNLKHAVMDKLNGTIVKPGEEFSLVQTLMPFTLEDGYYNELVILGNRLTPAVAGGLCQVGTTMFRAVMNSGLLVTARTNHGLWIPYYNDPRNGNPGTDATIFDPAPDFKFKNDTDHSILISVDMNVATGDMTFYLWGTSDGRQGVYTPPKRLQYIPAGEPKTIETSDLAPGKKECQEAHPGAVASFVYTRTWPDGRKEVKEFKSNYRAVPATCYVGKEATVPTPENPNPVPTPVFDPNIDLAIP